MSVVVELKPYEMIKPQLKKSDKIGIILCGICPIICGIGMNDMTKISKKLKEDGFNVVDMTVSADMCYFPNILKHKDLKGNVAIILGCEAAVYNVGKLFPKRKVLSAMTTFGLASFKGKKNVYVVRKLS